ncbi:unnamed protein product, partial [Mesorhabditis spiculigera]
MGGRILSYTASKSFSKKLNLPDRRNWRVYDDDVLFDHQAYIFVKSRNLLWDYYSAVKCVPATLTSKGFLVIYSSDNKGYIVHVPSATMIQVRTKQEKSGRWTHIKLRYPFGNVHVYAPNALGAQWRNLLTAAHDNRLEHILAAKKAALARSNPLKVRVAEEVEDKEPESEDESEPVSTAYSSLSDVNKPKYDFVARLNKPPPKCEEIGDAVTALEKQASAISWTCMEAPGNDDAAQPPVKCDAATNVPSGPFVKVMETFRETKERLFIRRWTKVQPTKSAPAVTETKNESEPTPAAPQNHLSQMSMSSNSGMFTDMTDTEPSIRQNPDHNVADLRAQLEQKLTMKQPEEKPKNRFRRVFKIASKRAVVNQLSMQSLTDVKDWCYGPGADPKIDESKA